MPRLPSFLFLFAALASFVRAADEDANFKYFRDIAETRSYSLGHPVGLRLTWKNYDTFYTERYLGLPQTDNAAYHISSVLTYAKQLARPLLLMHGLTDDNVYAQHTLQLADTLFMAGKPYEFLPMLGTHLTGSSEPVVQLRRQMRLIEFFNRELKP